ncbi:hypothetical protein OG735_02025 [Streptomyces sp. NBC_01210]|uniref:hypothetical protein n=1 Tax=Streptomyces sp. NBC_01210 TaxID=2903774 RepID=UPI002E11A9F3|nr:hypothetical protein OG735_02025 [Streptomyces sp. NBC_01210]
MEVPLAQTPPSHRPPPLHAKLGAGSTDACGYRADFGLLLAPCTPAVLLAARARGAWAEPIGGQRAMVLTLGVGVAWLV